MQRREFLQSSGLTFVVPSVSENKINVSDQELISEQLPKSRKRVIRLQTDIPDEVSLSRPDYSQIPPSQSDNDMFLSKASVSEKETDYLVVDDGVTFYSESGRCHLVPSIVSSAILYDGRADSDAVDCETECDEYPVYDDESMTVHYRGQKHDLNVGETLTLTGTFLMGDSLRGSKNAIPMDIKVIDAGQTDIYYHQDAIVIPRQYISQNTIKSFSDETEPTRSLEPQSQAQYSTIRKASNAQALLLYN